MVSWFKSDDVSRDSSEALAVCDEQPAGQTPAAIRTSIDETDPHVAALVERLCRELFSDDGPAATPPSCAARVLELARDPRANLADYAQLVESDPHLCEEVMALANGSIYAALPECESIAVAVLRVGVREVERLALRRAVEPQVFGLGEDDLAHVISRHCWLAALAAQTVARRTNGPAVAAFQAGLFHDVGKLAVLGILAEGRGPASDRLSAEFIRSAFDIYNGPASASVCRKWGLPEVVSSAVAAHHKPRGSHDALSTALFLGVHLAHALLGECEALSSPVVDEALERCGLTQPDLWELAALVAAQVEERQPTLA